MKNRTASCNTRRTDTRLSYLSSPQYGAGAQQFSHSVLLPQNYGNRRVSLTTRASDEKENKNK